MEAIQKSLSFSRYREVVERKILDFAFHYPEADRKELKEQFTLIFGEYYAQFADESFDKYDSIIDLANKEYKDFGVDIERDHHKIAAIEKINKTRIGKYEPKFVNRFVKVVRKSITEGADFPELRFRIRKIGGGVSDYADVLARTQLKGYGRAVKFEKANIAEIFYYEYWGIIRPDRTRQFCKDRLNGTSARGDNTYHIDEIWELDNGPKQLKPVIHYAGGWNCRHDWEPDPFYKP